jgi:hypothetical protein
MKSQIQSFQSGELDSAMTKTIELGIDTMSLVEKVDYLKTLNEHIFNKPVKLWKEADVAEWLKMIGLGDYQETFTKNNITGKNIFELTEADFRADLGITSIGHRKNLMKNIELLAETAKQSKTYNNYLKGKLKKLLGQKKRVRAPPRTKGYQIFTPEPESIIDEEADDANSKTGTANNTPRKHTMNDIPEGREQDEPHEENYDLKAGDRQNSGGEELDRPYDPDEECLIERYRGKTVDGQGSVISPGMKNSQLLALKPSPDMNSNSGLSRQGTNNKIPACSSPVMAPTSSILCLEDGLLYPEKRGSNKSFCEEKKENTKTELEEQSSGKQLPELLPAEIDKLRKEMSGHDERKEHDTRDERTLKNPGDEEETKSPGSKPQTDSSDSSSSSEDEQKSTRRQVDPLRGSKTQHIRTRRRDVQRKQPAYCVISVRGRRRRSIERDGF